MKRSDNEKKMLDELFTKKSAVPYNIPYISSTMVCTEPALGTIEADATGRFGRWEPEEFRAKKLASIAVSSAQFKTVLDIGGGNLLASAYFVNNGKTVDVCDFSTSPYLNKTSIQESGIRNFIDGDFNEAKIPNRYDLVWLSHVLEHQVNIQSFLLRVCGLIEENGYLAIAVPPRKPFIVSGHCNLFNPGLLVYRLILAGVDCRNAKVFQYDGNICLLTQVKRINLPKLAFDIGDIDILAKYFPLPVQEGFNGDFNHVNLSESELNLIYGKNLNFAILNGS